MSVMTKPEPTVLAEMEHGQSDRLHTLQREAPTIFAEVSGYLQPSDLLGVLSIQPCDTIKVVPIDNFGQCSKHGYVFIPRKTNPPAYRTKRQRSKHETRT